MHRILEALRITLQAIDRTQLIIRLRSPSGVFQNYLDIESVLNQPDCTAK